MFEHVLRLMWNRRKASRLVIVEIAAAFLVVFLVCALAIHAWGNYRRPLGFTYENTWRVRVFNETRTLRPGEKPEGLQEALQEVVAAIRRMPGVTAAHMIGGTPYEGNAGIGLLGREGAAVPTMRNVLSAGAVKDLGVRVVEGRTFGPQDQGQDYRAALVNREFVNVAFGGESPVGQRINFISEKDLAGASPGFRQWALREIRVVGVIDDFRQNGEFSEPMPYVIYDEWSEDLIRMDLFVKVAPGTDRRLEERIVAKVRDLAKGYSATVTPWEEIRAMNHLETLLPLRIGATLAAFLLAMVALGLIGIVWQDVVRRTQEIGVRRAVGAGGSAVRRQILLEVLVIGITGIAIGSLVAIQFPLLTIVKQIDWSAALPALGLSGLAVLLLAVGAALYPARLASRSEPADALRYE